MQLRIHHDELKNVEKFVLDLILDIRGVVENNNETHTIVINAGVKEIERTLKLLKKYRN